MEPIRIYAADFTLNSKYKCGTTYEITYLDASHSASNCEVYKAKYIAEYASTASHTASFDLATLPAGIKVKSATLCATVGSPAYGYEVLTINGVSSQKSGEVTIPVSVEAVAASVDVEFVYKCKATSHEHAFDGSPQVKHFWDGDNLEIYVFEAQHESVVGFTGVHLLIEFEDTYTPPELIPYTDPNPVAGETYVKAVHMTELHENVNRLRIAKGLTAYAFTAITAMQTSLAGWNAHVLEIRAALDEVSTEHDAWLALDVNRPRLDVLLQLRSMVEVLAA